jgi:hypothetical protein
VSTNRVSDPVQGCACSLDTLRNPADLFLGLSEEWERYDLRELDRVKGAERGEKIEKDRGRETLGAARTRGRGDGCCHTEQVPGEN